MIKKIILTEEEFDKLKVIDKMRKSELLKDSTRAKLYGYIRKELKANFQSFFLYNYNYYLFCENIINELNFSISTILKPNTIKAVCNNIVNFFGNNIELIYCDYNCENADINEYLYWYIIRLKVINEKESGLDVLLKMM